MTSEERLDKFENLLVQQGELIEKHESAIRDLIVVSRTTLTAVQGTQGSVQELREAQGATDEKLNILIETIERILRRLNGAG